MANIIFCQNIVSRMIDVIFCRCEKLPQRINRCAQSIIRNDMIIKKLNCSLFLEFSLGAKSLYHKEVNIYYQATCVTCYFPDNK